MDKNWAHTDFVKTLIIIILFLTLISSTNVACSLSNLTVEPAVTQYYSAGFQIGFTNINSSDWGKDINIYILRSEDNIPIEEIYLDSGTQMRYSIPDNGDYVTGMFFVDQKLQLEKNYVLWIQACGQNMTATFVVANQYGLIDIVGGWIIWFKDNIFAIVIGLLIFVLAILLARVVFQK